MAGALRRWGLVMVLVCTCRRACVRHRALVTAGPRGPCGALTTEDLAQLTLAADELLRLVAPSWVRSSLRRAGYAVAGLAEQLAAVTGERDDLLRRNREMMAIDARDLPCRVLDEPAVAPDADPSPFAHRRAGWSG